jgi:predicted lipoprotein
MPGRLAACLILGIFTLIADPAMPQEQTSTIVRQAIDGFVRPGYAAFHRAVSDLSATVDALCETPSQTALDAARQNFGETAAAWARIEIVRFGPVTEENRLERILFWPDRKGTGLRQVQAALAHKDPSASDPARLAGKSVAMQGLGALEFVLFGTGAEALAGPADPYRCAYGAAIAANLETIAGDVENAWTDADGFAARWASPRRDNPLYRDDKESLTELMDVFVTGFELVRDVRLGGFLGAEPDKDRPKQALFWRSGNTIAALAGNLAGMQALFTASGLGGAVGPDMGWIADSANFEFDNAAKAAAAADNPVAELLADPEKRAKLTYFGIVTSSLSEIFGTRLSAELGLTAGFSSLDGD